MIQTGLAALAYLAATLYQPLHVRGLEDISRMYDNSSKPMREAPMRKSIDDRLGISAVGPSPIEIALSSGPENKSVLPISDFMERHNYHAMKNNPVELLHLAKYIFNKFSPTGFREPYNDKNGLFIFTNRYDFDRDGVDDVIIMYSIAISVFPVRTKKGLGIRTVTRPYIIAAAFDSGDDNDINSEKGDDRQIVVKRNGPKFRKWIRPIRDRDPEI